MKKNDILFSHNFYLKEKNFSQLKMTLVVYFIQLIGCIVWFFYIRF